MSHLSVKGLVLAGGQSKRMGCDKRFLSHKGKSLLQNARDILQAALEDSLDSIWISGGDISGGLVDPFPNRGPLAGLLAAVETGLVRGDLTSMWLMVIPVDMPALTPMDLKNLVHALPKLEATHALALHYTGFELPLVLQVSEGTRLALKERLEGKGPHSLGALLMDLQAMAVEPSPLGGQVERLSVNTNTPENWDKWLASQESPHASQI